MILLFEKNTPFLRLRQSINFNSITINDEGEALVMGKVKGKVKGQSLVIEGFAKNDGFSPKRKGKTEKEIRNLLHKKAWR